MRKYIVMPCNRATDTAKNCAFADNRNAAATQSFARDLDGSGIH